MAQIYRSIELAVGGVVSAQSIRTFIPRADRLDILAEQFNQFGLFAMQ